MVELESEFESLTILDQYVEESNGITYTELSTLNLFDDYDSKYTASSGQDVVSSMDWGAFAWGFCCCPIGFFVVAVNSDKSQDEKMSYWIGVIVSSILSIISSAASGGYTYSSSTTY